MTRLLATHARHVAVLVPGPRIRESVQAVHVLHPGRKVDLADGHPIRVGVLGVVDLGGNVDR